MKIAEVRAMAGKIGVDTGKMKKPDIIRAIQKKEGNMPCFGTGIIDCAEINCLWRKDCVNE